MKPLLICMLLFATTALFAQSDSIEKKLLFNELTAKRIKQEKFSEIGIEWNRTIKEIGGYPTLPFNLNNEVYYSYLLEFENLTKEQLVNRSLEWMAINHSIYPNQMYSNVADGKIILQNTFTANNNYTGIYTCVISIKDKTMLIEYIKIGFKLFIPGHYSGDTWVNDSTSELPIDQVFPIILKRPNEWEWRLNLLKNADTFFKNEVNNHFNFIKNYDETYRF